MRSLRSVDRRAVRTVHAPPTIVRPLPEELDECRVYMLNVPINPALQKVEGRRSTEVALDIADLQLHDVRIGATSMQAEEPDGPLWV
jgi:hypothetical protein